MLRSQLIDGVGDAFLQKEAAEHLRLLLHQDFCQLHCRGYHRAILRPQQGCDKAGNWHIGQPILEHVFMAIVQGLTDGGKGLAPDLRL